MSFDMNPADEDTHGECRHEIERLRREFDRLAAAVDYDIHARLMNPRSRIADARLAAGDPFPAEKCMEILGVMDHPGDLAKSLSDSWKDVEIERLQHIVAALDKLFVKADVHLGEMNGFYYLAHRGNKYRGKSVSEVLLAAVDKMT